MSLPGRQYATFAGYEARPRAIERHRRDLETRTGGNWNIGGWMPRRLTFVAALLALVLVACSGSSDGGSAVAETATPGPTTTVTPSADPAQLTLLAVADDAIVVVAPETGATIDLTTFADLGIAAGDRPRMLLVNDLLWVAAGPGRLVAVDPVSGAVAETLEFGSTQPIADFSFRGSLLWALVGTPNVDAILLAVDRASGGLVFALDPPPGSPLGALGVSEDGVWVFGGAPPSMTSISRIDPGAGLVAQAVDTGLSVAHILVEGGSVWAAGTPPGDASAGAQVVRVDAESGALLATIEVGVAIRGLAAAGGSIWVADAGTEVSGALVHRIDPATNTVVQQIKVGAAGAGGLDIIADDGRLLATNGGEQRSYVIDAMTGDVLRSFAGASFPVAFR